NLYLKEIFTAPKTAGEKNYFVEMNLDLIKASVPYLRSLQVLFAFFSFLRCRGKISEIPGSCRNIVLFRVVVLPLRLSVEAPFRAPFASSFVVAGVATPCSQFRTHLRNFSFSSLVPIPPTPGGFWQRGRNRLKRDGVSFVGI